MCLRSGSTKHHSAGHKRLTQPVSATKMSPHIRESAMCTRRIFAALRSGATGQCSVHVTLVSLEATLPREGPRANITKVDIPHCCMEHLVTLHVSLVAEGLAAHVTSKRACLPPRPPEEL